MVLIRLVLDFSSFGQQGLVEVLSKEGNLRIIMLHQEFGDRAKLPWVVVMKEIYLLLVHTDGLFKALP